MNLDLVNYTMEKVVSQKHLLIQRHMFYSDIRESLVKLEGGGRIRQDGYVTVFSLFFLVLLLIHISNECCER